jgi:hypothetical protein
VIPPCFLSSIRVEKVGRFDWQFTDDLVFHSSRLRGVILLPAGSVIDFASTPRFLWSLLPKTGQYDYGCALHDGGYRGLLRTVGGQRIYLIKPLCDLLMDEGNAAVGVSRAERVMLLKGVQWFGRGYKGVQV